MALIFNLLRKKPFSRDEKFMAKNLISMWHSFATTNIPSFNGLRIEEAGLSLSYLEIYSNYDFKNVEMPKNFGETKFWTEIENTLTIKQTRDEL